jgi:AcrR family transcriptional regulator
VLQARLAGGSSNTLQRVRRKDQRVRREQIVAAARGVLIERGAVGLRVKDVADRAGLAPSSVLYYYPELDELLLEVFRQAMHRYADRRAQLVREREDPVHQLRLAIHLGVPSGPDDEESRLLYEADALTGASAAFAVLTSSFFDRQAMLYESVLEAGARRGDFDLAAPAETIARGLVALEDGLGLQVVVGHPAVDAGAAERILLAYASGLTGIDLAEVSVEAETAAA